MGSPSRQLTRHAGTASGSGALLPALAGWLIARVAVALGFAVAHGLSGTVAMPEGRLHLDQGLMTWDGTFYRVITSGWYSGPEVPAEAVRFFPGYPAAGRLVEFVFLGNTDLALLVLANGAALAAAVLLWHLAIEATGDRSVADRSAWMLGVIPAANVMVFAYSESLMLLVTAAFLLALLRGHPGWAAAAGLFAGVLRPSGVLLALPATVEAWSWYRRTATTGADPHDAGGGRTRRDLLVWASAVAAPAVGLLAALLIVSRRTGDLLEAYRIQRQLRDGFRDPLTRLAQAGIDFAGGHLHDVYNVAFALGFAALFVVAWRHRQRASWLVLMAVTWFVAVGGNNMDSVGRYCVVAAPFTIALAQFARTRNRQVVLATVGVAATVWFTAEVLLGRIIP